MTRLHRLAEDYTYSADNSTQTYKGYTEGYKQALKDASNLFKSSWNNPKYHGLPLHLGIEAVSQDVLSLDTETEG